MKIGIHKERYGKISERLKIYKEILEYNDIDAEYYDVSDFDFWDRVPELDYFIYRFSVYDDQKQTANCILPVLENCYGIKVYPNNNTAWSYDNKIKQVFLLKSKNFPLIDSWIFFDKKKAFKWIESAQYPFVFKLSSGTRSQNVILVKDKQQAKRIVKKIFGPGIVTDSMRIPGSTFLKDISFTKYLHEVGVKIKRYINGEDLSSYWNIQKNYCLFQKFLPFNKYDTRITIIGDRAFGFTREVRKNDFRASGSGKLNFNKDQIDLEMVQISFAVSEKFKFQTMAFDFIYDEEHHPKICEISYNFTDNAIKNAKGYWDKNLEWHESDMCAQYYELVDLLNYPDLKVPSYLQNISNS